MIRGNLDGAFGAERAPFPTGRTTVRSAYLRPLVEKTAISCRRIGCVAGEVRAS